MNVKLLQKIKKHIREEPTRFIMSWWSMKGSEQAILHDYAMITKYPKCNTAACIAGWALLLSGKNPNDSLCPSTDAAKLLELDPDQISTLFLVSSWPDKFKKFAKLKSPAARVKLAAQRINHFIKTKGAE